MTKKAQGDKKPVLRTVKITMTIREAAEVLGKTGREWAKENEYLDADSHDDVWHDGYSESNVLGTDISSEYVNDVKKILPMEVALAMEDSERDSMASQIGKARRQILENALEKINVSGEYVTVEGESISLGKGDSPCVLNATIDVPNASVTVTLKNPEHLINDLVNGVGQFYPPFDPYEEASLEDIKSSFISNADSYFDVYGDSFNTDMGRVEPNYSSKDFEEFVKERVANLSLIELAEGAVDAVDADRFESYAEAADHMVKVVEDCQKEALKKEMKKIIEKKSESQQAKLLGRLADF
jgi:hypothetical protein